MLLTIAFAATLIAQEPAAPAPLAPVHLPPTGCLAYAQWRDPARTVGTFAEHAVLTPLLAQLLATVRAENPDVEKLVTFIGTHFEGSASEELARLAGDGLAMWVTVEQEQQPGVTFALVSKDAATGEMRRAALFGAVEAFFGTPYALASATETYPTGRLWVLDESLFVFATPTNLYVSTARRPLEPFIEPKRAARGRRALERLVAAHDARAADQDVWAWLDMGALTTVATMNGATADSGEPLSNVVKLIELTRDPQAQSLLGPGVCHLADGASWSLGIAARGLDVDVLLASDGLAVQPATMPRASAPAALATGGHNVAHAVLHRDYATLLRERETIFDAQDLGDVAQQIAQIELLLGGLSLEEDVLPHLSPWMEVTSRTLTFANSPRPEMQLPAAALIMRVEDAPNLGQQLDAAFQSIVAIGNVERTQSGLPGMIMQLGRDGDQTWTTARYFAPGKGEPIDAKFNLMPAAALVGDHWVIATHEELLIDLFDELRAAAPTTGAAAEASSGERVERFTIDGPLLADLARPQMDALALANALNEGKTREQAREDMEGLVWLLERMRAAGTLTYEENAIAVRLALSFEDVGGPR